MILYAVDPGKHLSGVAVFVEGVLRAVDITNDPIVGDSDATAVCEKPQVYRRGRADPGDLVDLAIAAGRVTAHLPTTYLTPAQWKGQQTKAAQWRKARRALSDTEIAIVEGFVIPRGLSRKKKGLVGDLRDAVCLGLVHLGRL